MFRTYCAGMDREGERYDPIDIESPPPPRVRRGRVVIICVAVAAGALGVTGIVWASSTPSRSRRRHRPSDIYMGDTASSSSGLHRQTHRQDFQKSSYPSPDVPRPIAPRPLPPEGASGEPVVELPYGLVRGRRLENSVCSFQSMPYAEPPLPPDMRWAPPRDWTAQYKMAGGWDATAARPACPQDLLAKNAPRKHSEDCLHLSVFAPCRGLSAAQLPVIVFLHDGDFVGGDANAPQYNASKFVAREKIVFVSVNYRLGALGFLAGSAPSNTGNYGLQDQQSALRWVRRHISSFGGDPNQVTLYGHGTGGVSACAHYGAIPSSQGLFSRVIIGSGPCEALPKMTAKHQADSFAFLTGCGTDTAGCLMAKSIDELVASQGALDYWHENPSYRWLPVIDGSFLIGQPWEAIQQGAPTSQRVPMMLGVSADEGTVYAFADSDTHEMDRQIMAEKVGAYLKGLGPFFPELDRLTSSLGADRLAEAARDLYLGQVRNQSHASAYAKFLGDVRFVCPLRRLANAASQLGVSIRVYAWRHRCFPGRYPAKYGVYHGAEIPYVFDYNGPDSPHHCKRGLADDLLAQEFGRLMAVFASGKESELSKHWPRYIYTAPAQLLLVTDVGVRTAPSAAVKAFELCDFWESRIWGPTTK